MVAASLSSRAFYSEYHGHREEHLAVLEGAVRKNRSVVWLLGDSTLDNKHWFEDEEAAVNGYEAVLDTRRSRADVAHHVNKEIVRQGLGDELVCINTAVEEATLGARGAGQPLLHADTFCRDHLRADDVLIVSCGGNDIALRPTALTGISMVALLACPMWLLRSVGFTPGLCHLVPGLSHFIHLFGEAARRFVGRVTERTTPRAVVMCMLYFLDERAGGSWADGTLQFLGYNTKPEKLQLIMRIVYERAISQVQIEGTTVVPVPLYEVLDGKTTEDYEARVEPSSQGGQKMARLLLERLRAALPPRAAM